jgi:hypothetical protein
MQRETMSAVNAADQDDRIKIHTAHLMAEYLFSLSMMCKHFKWHKTGMHLCAGSDELKKMLQHNALTQRRYSSAG